MRPGRREGGVLLRGWRGVTERADDLDLITAALIQLIFEAAENSLSACGLARIVATVDGFFIRPAGGRLGGVRVARIVTFVCASNPVALQPGISQFCN